MSVLSLKDCAVFAGSLFIALSVKTVNAQGYPQCLPETGPIQISSNRCQTSPQQYKMSVFEIGLCKNDLVPNFDPSNPVNLFSELSSATPNSASCDVIFVADDQINGSDITLTGTTGGGLQGNTVLPPPGIYNYAYVKMKNVISISGVWTFSEGIFDSKPIPLEAPAQTCWTLSASIKMTEVVNLYNRTDNYPTNPNTPWLTECGASPSPGITTTIFDSFSGAGDTQLYIPSFTFTFYDGKSTTIKAFLVDSLGDLATETTPSQILYFTNFGPSQSLVIDENTASLNLEINNSLGATVNLYDAVNDDGQPISYGPPYYLNGISASGFLLRFSKN